MKKAVKKQGFTLVEIMIVVAIIGLLAAIGIPSFNKARSNAVKKSMENNARIVMSAVDQVAMEDALIAANDAPVWADVSDYVKGGADGLTVGKNTAITSFNFGTMTEYEAMGVTDVATELYSTYTDL